MPHPTPTPDHTGITIETDQAARAQKSCQLLPADFRNELFEANLSFFLATCGQLSATQEAEVVRRCCLVVTTATAKSHITQQKPDRNTNRLVSKSLRFPGSP